MAKDNKEEDKNNGKVKRKEYEKALHKLQAELCHLQAWVKETGARIILIFEGRDGAGKGGTIRAITERVSPRVFRVVALPAPSDREKTQMYMQRYMRTSRRRVKSSFLTGVGTTGPESNMSWAFAPKSSTKRFLELAPTVEGYITRAGIDLVKYWLEVSNEEQERRFQARLDDPLRQWKLSPMDLPSREKWYEYSRARDRMLDATDSKHAPWHLVRSDNKRRARLNIIKHFLSSIPYKKMPYKKVKLPKRSNKHQYDDQATLKGRKFIPEVY